MSDKVIIMSPSEAIEFNSLAFKKAAMEALVEWCIAGHTREVFEHIFFDCTYDVVCGLALFKEEFEAKGWKLEVTGTYPDVLSVKVRWEMPAPGDLI